MPANPTTDAVSVPRVLIGLAIDYFRWTQLVPMITAWAFLILMVAAMLLVNFQQQSFSMIEWGATTFECVFGANGPAPAVIEAGAEAEVAEGTDGAIRFSDEDFMPWVLRAWAVLALAGWLLGMLRALLFGPREPMRLKRKLVLAAVPAGASVALFALAYFFGSEEFHGSAVGWMLMFAGFPLGVWLVSAYSLAVTHGLDILRRRISESA